MIPDWMRAEVRRFRLHSWRHRGWMIRNWWNGLRFDAVGRCRYCEHTTPHHYPTCKTLATDA